MYTHIMVPKKKQQSTKKLAIQKGHAVKKTQKEVEDVVEKEGANVAAEVSQAVSVKVAKVATLEAAAAKATTLEVSEEVVEKEGPAVAPEVSQGLLRR